MYDSELGPDPALYAGLLLPEAVRLKRLDDILRQVADALERANDRGASEGQFPFDREAQFASDDFADCFDVRVVHWESLNVDWHSRQCSEVGYECQFSPTLRERPAARLPHREGAGDALGRNSHNGDMLIGDVQIVHGAENFISAVLVGFERADDSFDVVGSLPHLCFQFVLKAGDVRPKGEVHLFGLNAAEGYEVVCEDVQSRSEVVDRVTEDGGKLGRNSFSALQCYSVLAGVLVTLQKHGPRIALKVDGDFLMQLGGVLPTTRDL